MDLGHMPTSLQSTAAGPSIASINACKSLAICNTSTHWGRLQVLCHTELASRQSGLLNSGILDLNREVCIVIGQKSMGGG